MHPEIRKINWVYFRDGLDDYRDSFEGLLGLLGREKDYVHQHTVLLNDALEWERNQKQTRYLLPREDRQQAEAWLATRFKESQPPVVPTDLRYEYITESIKNGDNLMTRVFLSHGSEDAEVTEQVRRTLNLYSERYSSNHKKIHDQNCCAKYCLSNRCNDIVISSLWSIFRTISNPGVYRVSKLLK